jgi:hypothetical protein
MSRMAVHGWLVTRICDRRDAKGAVYAADNATNNATDETAKRSCRLHAHGSAMIDTVGDALCLRRKRESQ